MKLSKVLRVIGRGAAIAAEFTPAGAAASIGLNAAGKAFHQPDGVEDDAPETLREIAVQTVLANAGVILAAAIAAGQSKILTLDASTDAVESWLQGEAQAATIAEAKEKAGGA
jgi:hypothetical protein